MQVRLLEVVFRQGLPARRPSFSGCAGCFAGAAAHLRRDFSAVPRLVGVRFEVVRWVGEEMLLASPVLDGQAVNFAEVGVARDQD